MASRKKGLKIFPKLLITMLLVALIPLGGLWYINSLQAQADWKTNLDESLRNTSDGLAAQVNDWVGLNLRGLRQNAGLKDVMSMSPARQNPVLRSVDEVYEWTYLVFTIAPDGRNIGRSDGKSPKYYGDRQYFRQVMAGKPVGQQVLIGKTSKKPAVVIASPIKDPNGSTVGVIATASTLVEVSKAIASARIGKTGFAFLVNDKGKVIAHGQPNRLQQALQDFSGHPALTSSEDQLVFTEADTDVVAYRQNIGLGWTLVVQQNYDDAFAPLIRVHRNALILLLVTLVLATALALVFAHGLVKPIRKLTDVAESYSRGGLEREIPGTRRGDEVGALARAVERMGVSIQMAFGELKDKKAPV